MALVAAADVQARLSTQAYTRLFAKNGGSTVDATFLALMVAEAESQVRVWTQAAFPGGFDATGGTVDAAIVGACVDVVCYLAAKRHTSVGEHAAYRQGFDDAREFFKSLNRDRDARPVTAVTGRSKPRAEVDNLTTEGGIETNPYTRASDGRDPTGF